MTGPPARNRAHAAQWCEQMSNLEALRMGMVGQGPRAGWRETIGARIASVEPGEAVIELDVHAGHRHEGGAGGPGCPGRRPRGGSPPSEQGGVVQGGIITQIADAAMGMSLMTMQDVGMSNTTIELKINFLRPVVEGRLRAIGRVIAVRDTLLFGEADVLDERDRLVARASSTCLAIGRSDGGKQE